MASLEGKLSQFGDVVVLTEAKEYFDALNAKLAEVGIAQLTVQSSYLSKFEVVDELRSILREEYQQEQPSNIASPLPPEAFEEMKELLDPTNDIATLAQDEEAFTQLESYINVLADESKGAFNPPLAEPFIASEPATQVYPVPQSSELDPRRYGRILVCTEQFDPQQKSWLINNALLYGLTLYEDYALYYVGLASIKADATSATKVQELVNRFQKTPIPIESIQLTAQSIQQAKDPVVGDLDPCDLFDANGNPASVTDNNGNVFSKLFVLPGDRQTAPKEVAQAATKLVNAAKREGVNLRVSSGFRPAAGPKITWKSQKGKSGSLTTQESLRRASGRFVNGHSSYKKFITDNGSSDGSFGTKSGEEGFVFYAGSSAYNPATAPPGRSNHGSGIACDFNTGGRKNFGPLRTENYVWLCKNAHKFGFIRAVSSEEWHFEYRPDEAVQGPYARVKPGSGGKLENNGWYPDLGLDNLTA